MVTEALARGGAERQMIALAHGLRQRGYDVQVFELIGTVPGQPSFASEFSKMNMRLRGPSEFSNDDKGDFANIQMHDLQPFAPLLLANSASVCGALLRVI